MTRVLRQQRHASDSSYAHVIGARFDSASLAMSDGNFDSHNLSFASSRLALGVMDCAELRACAAQYLEILKMPLAGILETSRLVHASARSEIIKT